MDIETYACMHGWVDGWSLGRVFPPVFPSIHSPFPYLIWSELPTLIFSPRQENGKVYRDVCMDAWMGGWVESRSPVSLSFFPSIHSPFIPLYHNSIPQKKKKKRKKNPEPWKDVVCKITLPASFTLHIIDAYAFYCIVWYCIVLYCIVLCYAYVRSVRSHEYDLLVGWVGDVMWCDLMWWGRVQVYAASGAGIYFTCMMGEYY